MRQSGLTVIVEIDSQRADHLRGALEAAKARDPFRGMKGMHHAAFVILPEIDGLPPRLVMETNYDGSLGHHLDELISRGAEVLDDIYGNYCKGYPPGGAEPIRNA